MKHISLTHRFMALLMLFTGVIMAVLYMLVSAKNEPIDFGKAEATGNIYQRPVEKIFRHLARHRVFAQRALYGDKDSKKAHLDELQKLIDAGVSDLEKTDREVGEFLQFTEKGLHSRKRDHLTVANFVKEWADLKSKLSGLKPAESNDLHSHLIADLRGMIAHLGDTSNLILDPDLDSYYLMDVTLLALPQAQERIQNVIVEMEPWLRRKHVSTDDRVKASVFASMMNEADLERIKADFQTVLNEDGNFYGKLDTLESKLGPQNQKFLAAYKEFVDLTNVVAGGQPVTIEKFLAVSDKAMTESFDYWDSADDELDKLINKRLDFYHNSKTKGTVFSVLCLLFALGVSTLFMRYLVRNMRQIMTVLNQSSQQVSTASAQSAASATTLSEASTEQAASLQETMASVEEISAMVSQNAESANKTRDAVDANQKVSEDGSMSVQEMLSAIGEIKLTNEEILTQMENSNKEFGEIVKIISEIGEKTNVINEIVFQTKLLSFNASVEAARAGEHGKGFAVVAEEVGNLAQMSGNAAKEITDMLSDSIKKVNEIVERTRERVEKLVELGKDKITMGQATAQKCSEALQKITQNARTVTSMIGEITSASKEQAQGIQEINKAISQLDSVTQQNSAVAHQSSTQADQLSQEAQSLTAAVQKLVAFVDGSKNVQNHHDEHMAHHEAHANRQVLPMKATAAKRPAPRTNGHKNHTVKKAVGASTPSGQDPRFEDF